VIYSAVASRRNQFDALAWQVPLISFTAQAFLFLIALSPDSSQVARTIAGSLSVLIATLSILLLARHRQGEIADAEWLERVESSMKAELHVHGDPWRKRREAVLPGRGLFSGIPLLNAYAVWVCGLWLIGATAGFVVVLTWTAPELLS